MTGPQHRRRTFGVGVAGLLALAATVVAPPPVAAADPPVVASLVVEDPGAGAPVPVVVDATDATSVVAQVVVGFAAPVALALVDDGTGGDAVAGDGRWTGLFTGQPAGTLVRARAVATGPGGDTPFPDEDDEAPHVGVVVARPAVATALPLIDWYIAPADHQALMTQIGSKTYRPAVLVVGDVVYDGVRVRLQGGPVSQSFPKKNLRFKMAKGHDLVVPSLSERPLEELILDAESDDASGIWAELAWGVVDAAGGPTVAHGKVRLERNGAFEGLYTFFEEYDDEWMEAAGVEDGLLYESEDSALLQDVGPEALGEMWDQKEPEDAPHDALAALAAAVDGPVAAVTQADLLEQVDVADLVSYYAVNAVLSNIDTVNHNIWLLQDPGTDRWSPLHWDLDQVFGRPLEAPPTSPILPSVLHLSAAVAGDARLSEMVLRRVRTLADEVLGADGLVASAIDPLEAEVAPDRSLDRARWPQSSTPAAAEAHLRAWLVEREAAVDGPWSAPGGVPPARTGADRVVISEIRSTGDAAGDFVELANPGTTSVDVSGWTLSGATTATLPAGAVVPAGDRIAVPVAGAALGPAARDRLVVGTLDAPLPDGGGELVLRSPGGTEEGRAAWQPGAPWPAAPGGRSIERVDLAAGIPAASAWRASSAVGGTPGAPWAAPTGLSVALWADGRIVAPDSTINVSIEVANDGPSALTDVAVTGPARCARTLPRLPVGVRRIVTCTVDSFDDVFGFHILRATATASGAGTVASAGRIVTTVLGAEGQPPTIPLDEVLLDPAGGLRASWTPQPGAPIQHFEVTELAPGRVRPLRGSSVPGDAGSARVTPPIGVPVRLAMAPNQILTRPGSTPAPAITPRPSTTWPSASPSAWAARTLRIVLRRAPTPSEVDVWTTALAGGTPPAELIDVELARGRWAAQEAKVARLYAAFFDRPAETDGLAYWSGRLAAGAQISVVAESFARSPEFQARFGAGTHAAFVDLVYRGVLGRAPGAGDVDYWVGRIQGGKTRGWVMAAFSESSEGRTRLAPKTDPVVISYALTGAAWTVQPYEDALAWLRAGGSRRTVVEAARTDPAFATR